MRNCVVINIFYLMDSNYYFDYISCVYIPFTKVTGGKVWIFLIIYH